MERLRLGAVVLAAHEVSRALIVRVAVALIDVAGVGCRAAVVATGARFTRGGTFLHLQRLRGRGFNWKIKVSLEIHFTVKKVLQEV